MYVLDCLIRGRDVDASLPYGIHGTDKARSPAMTAPFCQHSIDSFYAQTYINNDDTDTETGRDPTAEAAAEAAAEAETMAAAEAQTSTSAP